MRVNIDSVVLIGGGNMGFAMLRGWLGHGVVTSHRIAVVEPVEALRARAAAFSANPITMTAGLVAMQMFDRDAVASLNSLADRARAGIAEAIKIADVPACVTGAGSMFRIHLKGTAPTSYRSAFAGPKEQNCISALLDHFFANGLLMIETCSGLLSTPMTKTEIDRLSEVVLDGLRLVRPMLDDIQVASTRVAIERQT
ncbi:MULTISPECIES: NAD(P)-binding domain-containing protein [unclassified Mesorhizobium]|uniref:NAD(P)-binding domain-containing protein n=1 Tax=unclassified Mesorhizobium TaxID=325217 RepID=UPI000FCC9846|nr:MULTISPECIES: NAD(P)-binding domain-containing protein [unclassified Mesorhizobium]RUX91991.1 hypothetical protein EN993_24965 [Mesorhizobium sp. M7D.F.Ca.US.004.01.2.1]RVA29772.1 hypothetical protein EN935_16245 [Mesorhizobium sp. M7D.F.Ca.US.004.03.1.1]